MHDHPRLAGHLSWLRFGGHPRCVQWGHMHATAYAIFSADHQSSVCYNWHACQVSAGHASFAGPWWSVMKASYFGMSEMYRMYPTVFLPKSICFCLNSKRWMSCNCSCWETSFSDAIRRCGKWWRGTFRDVGKMSTAITESFSKSRLARLCLLGRDDSDVLQLWKSESVLLLPFTAGILVTINAQHL